MNITILDTTLREGEQTPGVCFDVHIKLAFADLLARLRVEVIEAGHPAVTQEIRRAVTLLAARGLGPRVGAHARSLESDVDLALACGVGFLGVFYCVTDERLEDHGQSLTRAVDRIARVIAYAREQRPDLWIRYTPEDTVRSPFENVLTASAAAVQAGAGIISVADTTGFLIPGTGRDMYGFVSRLRDGLAARGAFPKIAVHCHNDRGLALANALDGLRAGAEIVDASVLGLGERAGIVDLATLLAVLAHDFGEAKRWDLTVLPELYDLASRYARIPVPVHFPVTGRNAFTHCAGIHTQAATRNPLHYQSLPAELVGRKPEIALDHMSGLASVRHCLELLGSEAGEELARAVLRRVKEVGQTGRTVDLLELKYIVRALETPEGESRVGAVATSLGREPEEKTGTC